MIQKINDTSENILPLLFAAEGKMAFSDEQVEAIKDKLLVTSPEEFERKFNSDPVIPKLPERSERAEIPFVEMLRNDTENSWEILCCGQKPVSSEEEESNEGAGIRRWIEAFFAQAEEGAELIICNVKPEEFVNEKALSLLELLFETTNTKAETREQIHQCIIPEVSPELMNLMQYRIEKML